MVMSVVILISKLWVDGITKVLSLILPSPLRKTLDDSNYLQRSSIPTMHYQASLPRLPIPKLEDSCRRYLRAQEPILSPVDFEKTCKNVEDFLSNEGPHLHEKLLKIDEENKDTSYISEPWFDMYHRDRRPLPLNSVPWMLFHQLKNPAYEDQLVKTTNILISSARFMNSLRAGLLEPEVYHLNKQKSDTNLFRIVTRLLPSRLATYGAYLFQAFPLDMSQYRHLFGTSRIPEIGKDRILNDPHSRHVLIMRKGYSYCFDLLNDDGSIRSPCDIASCLNAILQDPREPNPHPLAIFTTTERDEWARNRQHLMSLGNQEVLKKIDTAALALVLDDHLTSDHLRDVLPHALHSDGRNRWYDKSFTLTVTGCGSTWLNFEHSWGDGIAISRFCTDMMNDVIKNPHFHPADRSKLSPSPPDLEQLEFKLDHTILEAMDRALEAYRHLTEDLVSIDYVYQDYFSKKHCKAAGVSPDAVMQLSFQLTLYKLERQMVPTYESGSTAAFKHGRTETIRSCTNETKALCRAIVECENFEGNIPEFKKLLVKCSETHTSLTKEAAMGQGFDRHLFILKRIWQEEKCGDLPQIFQDPAYAKLNEIILSTSTLGSPVLVGGGFGPAVAHGYGVGYFLDDAGIRMGVTSYKQHRDAAEYIACARDVFEQIKKILDCK